MAGLQASGETLWALLEEDDGYIPQDLKLILQATKFDNIFALSRSDLEKDTRGIECFMQKTLHSLISPTEYQAYYDIFKNHPENFILVGGHRAALKLLVEKSKAIIALNRKRLSTDVDDNGTKARPSSSTKKSKVSNPVSSDKAVCDAKLVLQKSLKIYIHDHYPTLKDTEITCTVVKDGFDSFVAEANCPVKECTEKRKITRNESRWNTSNFYAHVLTHFATRSKKKPSKNVTPINSIFKPIGGKSRNSRTVTASDEDYNPQEVIVSENSSNEEEFGLAKDKQNPEGSSATRSNNDSSGTVTQKSNVGGKPRRRTAYISSDEEITPPAGNEFETPTGNENEAPRHPEDRQNGGVHDAAQALHNQEWENRHHKWTLNQYSRTERQKRKLMVAAEDCQPITKYFKILNEMEILMTKYEELTQELAKAMQDKFINNNKKEPPKISFMLELLLQSAIQNADKKTGGERYEDVLKELGYLLFHYGGLQLYELLCHNLPLPSVTTIRRVIYKEDVIIEGAFRIKELKEFLESRNYPLKVFLSEDATVVAKRVQYQPSTNQIVGFPLPSDENGMPVVGAFPATSAEVIARYFSENPTSSSAYCIVAQPLVPKSPTFVVAMFGTNNKFTAQQVQRRWQWTISALAAVGIEVLGFSSDGDSKLLKCMTFNMVTASPNSKWPWFRAKKSMPFVCVQDAIHVGNKLKSRLLSPSIILPFGNFLMATSGHLVERIQKHQLKDQHLLCLSDLNSKDKMNHAAMMRMSDKKVTELLRNKVEGSLATAQYLDMMREVVEAFTSVSLTPLERIKVIWTWVFYLQLWRDKILKTPGYTLDSNSHNKKCILLH